MWERMKLAQQWVWEEYPDQVLIQEGERIKWPRYLSAAVPSINSFTLKYLSLHDTKRPHEFIDPMTSLS
jgi:hypothetical protein